MSEARDHSQTVVKLPARLDTNAATDVRALLLDASADGETELCLDASEVDYIGGLCLQLIIASRARIGACSEKASEALELFGMRSQLVEGYEPKEVSAL